MSIAAPARNVPITGHGAGVVGAGRDVGGGDVGVVRLEGMFLVRRPDASVVDPAVREPVPPHPAGFIPQWAEEHAEGIARLWDECVRRFNAAGYGMADSYGSGGGRIWGSERYSET